jgi:hypothetical protein
MKHSVVFIEMGLKMYKVVVHVEELGSLLNYFTYPLQSVPVAANVNQLELF